MQNELTTSEKRACIERWCYEFIVYQKHNSDEVGSYSCHARIMMTSYMSYGVYTQVQIHYDDTIDDAFEMVQINLWKMVCYVSIERRKI